MAKLNLSYRELQELDFVRYDYTDRVFYDQHGYDPFIMCFQLSKKIKMEIHCEFDHAVIYKAKKKPYEENFRTIIQLNTKEEIQLTLAVFGHFTQAERLNGPKDSNNPDCDGDCSMNYCDDNGCIERKRNLVDQDPIEKEATHV
jgi:6-pyruvoyl-tetrahydropterin synthase